ncbi:DNA-binding MarR family transcriptional regulator [Hamadaea flava]|uniref:MarR family winged helix-turn-helix transcriptional regulator n=1 Tax=Hamadaea flava TaxID=1742688 RepID=A0ABV8LSJ6_9ACTN|nr:MarR family transcriptional regulator [Hamadaea flava]MCP2327179.1 DNA-binding MarR family transcriptional regulator [Hamadaea flava]
MTSKDAAIARIMAGQRQFQLAMARDRTNPFFAVNLTMSQLKILFALRLHGGQGGHELAQKMGVSPATMTGIVDRLVAGRYVSRREDPHDRRVRLVELTERGTTIVDDIMTVGEEHSRRILARLSVDELSVVADAMDILGRALVEDATAAESERDTA